MSRVGLVTDSTCDIALEELAKLDVRMVPLKVLFGDETFLDWVELAPRDFYPKLLASPTLPKTSQPSPAEFLAAYEELAHAGCDAIVSIHLSGPLSGTVSSATIAAGDSPVPVHVVDSKKVSQALGLVVRAAVALRDQGADAEAVASHAREVSEKMRLYFVLDTLDYLVKGGRAGKAQGLAASLLGIKPVLDVNAEGIVEPFKKVKGRRRALHEIADHVAEDAARNGRMRLVVLHACAEDNGEELLAEIRSSGADVELMEPGVIGAVIGTYVGPGAIGCAYHPIT